MKIVDFVLHPGTLLVLMAAAIITAFAIENERSSVLRTPPAGLIGGLFLFASAALIAAVWRRHHIDF